ncbi:MAG: hypothetical protein M5R36_21875 [Deltaproteobacteria bacterium]|nr:hypothetical protein [Deltaproteobacteria bacterium]
MTRRRFPVIVTAVILFLMLFPMTLHAENPAEEGASPQNDAKLKSKQAKILRVQEMISDAYAADEPDLLAIGNMYEAIFALLPNDQQGKMAVWEAFHVYRKAGDRTRAMSMLRTIYAAYNYDSVMENPLDDEHPLHMHGSADVEQADLYRTMFDQPLSAVGQLKGLPVRRAGVYVGIIDGDRTYFGHVDVIGPLKTAEAHRSAKQYNAAIMDLRGVLEDQTVRWVGDALGVRDLEWIVMKRLGEILDEMPATMTKKIVELGEMDKLVRSKLAHAEAHFVRAALFETKARETMNSGDIAQAEADYRAVVDDSADLKYLTKRGDELMGPRAVAALARLFTVTFDRPQRAVQVLEDVEKSLRDRPEATDARAYARYHLAYVLAKNIGNVEQALLTLADFGDDFPGTVLYPHKEESRRMLFELALDLERELKASRLPAMPAPPSAEAAP